MSIDDAVAGLQDVRFATKVKRGEALSTSSAESFAKAALSKNKTTDEKIELIAKSLAELAKTLGSMERDISRIKNASGKSD
jgi:phage shock protein A